LVDEGYRCPVCGGEVALIPNEPPVGVAPDADGTPGEESSARRFDR
jgi:hypothetical protein